MSLKRRCTKRTETLETRLAKQANRLREEAKLLPPGADRGSILRKAQHVEMGSQVTEWLRSPGLRPPK
jgi:hypothetical protein